MGDLDDISGLPIRLDQGAIRFRSGLPEVPRRERHLHDMADVLLDPAQGPQILYLMYRKVAWPRHERHFATAGLRYDITVLAPGFLGREYVKTLGHYHALKPGMALAHPEIYQVLHGEAFFILQKPGSNPRQVKDVLAVTASAGEALVLPPGYGHVTVNRAEMIPLVMANLISEEVDALYEPFARTRGASYYMTPAGFLRNPSYERVPPLRIVEPPSLSPLSLERGLCLYSRFILNPPSFAFLSHPGIHSAALEAYTKSLQEG